MHDPDFIDDAPDFLIADEESDRPDIWQRLSRVMEVILYLLIMAAIAKHFWPEIERQNELMAELQTIENRREMREAEVEALRNEHQWLKNDREYVESVARDRLDMARADEHIVRFVRDGVEE